MDPQHCFEGKLWETNIGFLKWNKKLNYADILLGSSLSSIIRLLMESGYQILQIRTREREGEGEGRGRGGGGEGRGGSWVAREIKEMAVRGG
jgi:hypothetical protein